LTPSPQIEKAGSEESWRERAVYQIFSVVDQPIMEAENPHDDEADKDDTAIWLVSMASKHGRLLGCGCAFAGVHDAVRLHGDTHHGPQRIV
jgi:hypothetical protein